MENHFNHLVDLDNYSISSWNDIIELAQEIMKNPAEYGEKCKGKIMGTLFYEPSTRTQMSFQSAMLRLGGSIIGFDNPATSSVSKGENLKDTTKIVSGYSDILVIRHPGEGAAKATALTADCPIINAGDGGHLHPTQTLTDLLTLKIEKERLTDLVVGICGDLRNGRTVHSLIKALSRYKGNKFILISTKELQIPAYIKDVLYANGCDFEETCSLADKISELDVLYMTRIQKERFKTEQEYIDQKDIYILDHEKMLLASKNLIVMHPLPRVDEISTEVDDDSRSVYFKQAKYGVFVRMALILTILYENPQPAPLLTGVNYHDICCTNENCITNHEKYLPKSYYKLGDMMECEYCGETILV